ncbi:hypothetical protein GYA93_12510 [Gordonia desulfuricans]|uniref:Uncharacterized protein n=1 Tax=Gordonia desulfuricans TaxID=89051 RepID=A0A7K3LQ81_9ACTN|nr:hypothetical protein [Gordonia desulfuricans]NDK90393.1 hypothetical protein [Gordonia desulfuricans]
MNTVFDDVDEPARAALIAAVRRESDGLPWEVARRQWDVVDTDYDDDCTGVCVCGQTGLGWLYTITNREAGSMLYPIGSDCIAHFAVDVMVETARDLAELERLRLWVASGVPLDLKTHLSRRRLRVLFERGLVARDDYEMLRASYNRRRPLTVDEHVSAERVLREGIAPALGGDPEAEIVDNPLYVNGHRDVFARGVAVPPAGATSAYVIGHADGARLRMDVDGTFAA